MPVYNVASLLYVLIRCIFWTIALLNCIVCGGGTLLWIAADSLCIYAAVMMLWSRLLGFLPMLLRNFELQIELKLCCVFKKCFLVLAVHKAVFVAGWGATFNLRGGLLSLPSS